MVLAIEYDEAEVLGFGVIAFPSMVTVGATCRISDADIVSVTMSPVFARVDVELFDDIDVVSSGSVMSIVTDDPSVVAVSAEAPTFSFSS